jgi:hypothetical protein
MIAEAKKIPLQENAKPLQLLFEFANFFLSAAFLKNPE